MPVTRGTVALTNGSKAVVGTGTKWISDCVRPGALFALADEHGVIDMSSTYSVASVDSETSITLDQEWQGDTASELAYAIADAGGEKMSSDVYNLLASKIGEIEEVLERADGTATAGNFVTLDNDGKVSVTQVPDSALNQNDNLLDNWFFADPINQRGLTTYYSESAPIPTIDRWNASKYTKVEIISTGIKVSWFEGDSPHGFVQRIERPDRIAGQKVTVSLDVVEATGRVAVYFACGGGHGTTGMIINAGQTGIKSFTVTLPSSADINGSLSLVIVLGDTATITLRAAELCIGSAGSLKRGMCPNYGEQEAIARRYLLPLSEDQRFRAVCIMPDVLQFIIPTPRTMRIAPSVEDITKFSIRTLAAGSSGKSIESIEVIRNDTALLIKVTSPAHGLSDALLYAEAATFLSAEM